MQEWGLMIKRRKEEEVENQKLILKLRMWYWWFETRLQTEDRAFWSMLQRYDFNAAVCKLSKRQRCLEEIVHTYLMETYDSDQSQWRQAAVETNRLFLEAVVAERA